MTTDHDPYNLLAHCPAGKLPQVVRLLVLVEVAKAPCGVSERMLLKRFDVHRSTLYRDLKLVGKLYRVWTSGRARKRRIYVGPLPIDPSISNRDRNPLHTLQQADGRRTAAD